ncbi:hypothetical protein BHM03_00034852 [Ensete ventricosum]|uniref:Uncharacterized protein n=1 Tax=Ensete ventricosum TaxID=4639 RepID=A0A426YT08_ENSVE|nr:hypothetical protein B296_00025189 [Ensete ventricosum]RZS04506.1 hypothetical protein BHM03_00034852 [Ensete ventricosum]
MRSRQACESTSLPNLGRRRHGRRRDRARTSAFVRACSSVKPDAGTPFEARLNEVYVMCAWLCLGTYAMR